MRLHIILRDALAIGVHDTEVVQGDGVPLVSERAEKTNRGRVVTLAVSGVRILPRVRLGGAMASAPKRISLSLSPKRRLREPPPPFSEPRARGLSRPAVCGTIIKSQLFDQR